MIKIICLLICLNLTSAFAQTDSFISDILGPFPAMGSAEEKFDLATLLFLQKIRTKEQCAKANSEADASLETLFGGKNGLLNNEEVKRMQKKLRWVTIKAGAKIVYFKTKYNRSRPYINYPEVKPCIELESSKAYPSGHTTIARVYARILAEIFPERGALFLLRAEEVAFNRVLGGVHHPSDIEAGKILGDDLAEEYLSESDLQ